MKKKKKHQNGVDDYKNDQYNFIPLFYILSIKIMIKREKM